MIEVGKVQVLKVKAEDSSGFYLVCPEDDEVFLPGTLAQQGAAEGDDLEVFVFIDGRGDRLATSQRPLAQKGDLACLKVVEETDFGAYLDMGAPKDLLVPSKLQKYPMDVGSYHVVKIQEDAETGKLFGTEVVGAFLQKPSDLKSRQHVVVRPFHATKLGYKCLIDGTYMGMIYHNETFIKVELGEEYPGAVSQVRPDGRVDALLTRTGRAATKDAVEMVLAKLEAAGGRLDLSDRSPKEEIYSLLNMSKKSFKNAVGSLYKSRKITIGQGYIETLR